MSTMQFKSPVDIADTLVACLEAATWLRPDGETEAAFGRVERYSAMDLPAAIESLLMSDGRIAVVVPVSSRWETMDREHGLAPVCRRTVRVAVLVSDRRIGDADAAAYGSDENPGAIGLQELAIANCSGPLFASGVEVYSAPVSDELGMVERDGASVPGRVMSSIEFDCVTTWMEVIA